MKTEGPTERQPQVATSAVVCDEVPMKKYVAIVTASIVVEGFDSDDAAQAWKVSRVLHDLKKHGWTAHVDVCSHTHSSWMPHLQPSTSRKMPCGIPCSVWFPDVGKKSSNRTCDM